MAVITPVQGSSALDRIMLKIYDFKWLWIEVKPDRLSRHILSACVHSEKLKYYC